MEVSKKQRQFLELMEDPTLTELLIGGAAGGSKSFCIGLLVALWSKQYPGIRFFVGRKTLKSLKQSTINTMINKVFPALDIGYNDYWMRFGDMTLQFPNGSMVIFGELDYQPSDSEFARLGSLEIDIAIVDEAGEITKAAKDVLKSRTGRGILAQQYGMPGKIILACNPQTNFLFSEYYEPYEKLGGGGFQKWQVGEVTINEGSPEEKVMPAYRGFLRMGAYDNPFLPQSYIDNLKALPDVQRRRLLDGNWRYADEDNMLFKAGLLDKAITYELPEPTEKFESYIGVDVAGTGGDRSVYTLIKNGTVITQVVSKIQANWDKQSEQPLFRLMADELIELAQRNGFSSKDAKHIAVEGNGIGQALITTMKERGWYIREFTATNKTRGENYNQLQLDFDSGAIKLYHELGTIDDLRKELSAHTFKFENQVISVEKKDKIKQRLGRSPDLADSLSIAGWCFHQNTDKLDDRHNQRRILF